MTIKDFQKFIETRSKELSWVKSTLQNLFDNSLLIRQLGTCQKLLPQVRRYGGMKLMG